MTQTTDTAFILEVRGDKPGQIREDLDLAVKRVISHAVEIGQHGVLVTQHNYCLYSVTLSEDVPYGQIEERRSAECESGVTALPAPCGRESY